MARKRNYSNYFSAGKNIVHTLLFIGTCIDNMTGSILRYHGRWIDSVWKSRPYADAFKENPINLYIF